MSLLHTRVGERCTVCRTGPALLVSLLWASPLQAVDLREVRGFGIDNPGGRGGRVLRVTSLDTDGEGSLRWALEQRGPRIVVFEVGGVIDLAKRSLRVTEPYLTVAGETAPPPGVTLIRGGLAIHSHDVTIRHLMIRPGDNGEAPRSGWEPDALSVSGPGAHDVLIDHCSLTWALDENASVSGPRDRGHAFTARRVTFSHSIIAEGLDHATHRKGRHSKGLLVHDFVEEVAVIGNLFAHNDRRNPYFKGHTSGVVVNNVMYNIGNAAVQLGFVADEYRHTPFTPRNPRVAVVGNVLRYGVSSYSDLPLVAYQGDAFVDDNQVVNLDGRPMPQVHGAVTLLSAAPVWPAGLEPLPVTQVLESVLKNAGARPWDRDPIDRRIVASVTGGIGRIIDSQSEVGGYPRYPMSRRKLDVPTGDGVEEWLARFVP